LSEDGKVPHMSLVNCLRLLSEREGFGMLSQSDGISCDCGLVENILKSSEASSKTVLDNRSLSSWVRTFQECSSCTPARVPTSCPLPSTLNPRGGRKIETKILDCKEGGGLLRLGSAGRGGVGGFIEVMRCRTCSNICAQCQVCRLRVWLRSESFCRPHADQKG
jgi:hypothetical protein